MLKSIKIEGLFNQFNYNIELKDEGITILTGPNGYGKTTILKILYAFFATKNLARFFTLPFKAIFFDFPDKSIKILKKDIEVIEIKMGNGKLISYKKSDIMPKEIKRWLENSSYQQISENKWIDLRNEVVITTEDLINQFIENNPDVQIKFLGKQIPDLIQSVYLISEQRLLRKRIGLRKRNIPYLMEEVMKDSYINAIEEYAMDLSKNLKEILAKASKKGQELDSTFPRRLFDEKDSILEDEFNKRFDKIKEKQKSLSQYGLSVMEEETHTSFRLENAKALLVYLNDTEQKLSVFDGYLEKLEIFTSILNERGFAHKELDISPEFGFRFKTRQENKELALTDLSSGEQQEVVLLYELIFKVNPNTLVLIDEPEISLHVAWQKEFINDLLKIVKLQKITVITATHSPQIIDKHWDLTVDLKEISE